MEEIESDIEEMNENVFPLRLLPNEIKLVIFLKLELKDLAVMMRVSREWHDIIHSQSSWKQLCERDLKDFLYTKPLEEIEFSPGIKSSIQDIWKSDACGRDFSVSDIWKSDACGNVFQASVPQDSQDKGTPSSTSTSNNEEWEEWKVQSFVPEGNSDSENEEHNEGMQHHHEDSNSAVRFFIKKRKAKYDLGGEEKLAKRTPAVRNWLNFYQFCKKSENLTGIWTACYGTHGDEYVQVDHNGYNLRATKITGDIHIPAGKPTFNICLSSDLMTGKGEIHLAEANYESPRWGEASFQLKDKDSFDVMWPFQTTYHSFICTLHFRRKPDHVEIPQELLLQKQQQQIAS
eukprot:TRINITY_DN544_c0_g1_i1.p1 TRINITY_DN544_c0_g1~~TRINITY_DN544_c0_g1_i1.p1  ORF type:complete len:346 (+),score=95.42 TRINITY_DN544_c0_g1_i1:229-1266(+)